MSRIIRGTIAAVLLAAVAACTTAPAQTDLTPPPRKLDAKTQLECGTKKGC